MKKNKNDFRNKVNKKELIKRKKRKKEAKINEK